ncbi:hypothetical protein [Microbacterium sp. Se5.02b]|uniref:hypothetical protein n=1 Tax=Microbacterium sp. Se5.02b TaxID=2864103 RepID=UPI00215D9820|nr:hypothetical protein [Microbacterium sp. Se5.02b]
MPNGCVGCVYEAAVGMPKAAPDAVAAVGAADASYPRGTDSITGAGGVCDVNVDGTSCPCAGAAGAAAAGAVGSAAASVAGWAATSAASVDGTASFDAGTEWSWVLSSFMVCAPSTTISE